MGLEGRNTLNYYILVAICQIRRNALLGANSRISKGMDKVCFDGFFIQEKMAGFLYYSAVVEKKSEK